MHPDYYWFLLGACAIALLWAAGVRRVLCPPVAFMMSIVVAVFLLAYIGVTSGAYVEAQDAPVATPSPTPAPAPVKKALHKKKRHAPARAKPAISN